MLAVRDWPTALGFFLIFLYAILHELLLPLFKFVRVSPQHLLVALTLGGEVVLSSRLWRHALIFKVVVLARSTTLLWHLLLLRLWLWLLGIVSVLSLWVEHF